MKAKLTQLKSTHDKVRTKEIVGEYYWEPEMDGRVLRTSPITFVSTLPSGATIFVTQNSTYMLEDLADGRLLCGASTEGATDGTSEAGTPE